MTQAGCAGDTQCNGLVVNIPRQQVIPVYTRSYGRYCTIFINTMLID